MGAADSVRHTCAVRDPVRNSSCNRNPATGTYVRIGLGYRGRVRCSGPRCPSSRRTGSAPFVCLSSIATSQMEGRAHVDVGPGPTRCRVARRRLPLPPCSRPDRVPVVGARRAAPTLPGQTAGSQAVAVLPRMTGTGCPRSRVRSETFLGSRDRKRTAPLPITASYGVSGGLSRYITRRLNNMKSHANP
jgi:hypothetical protein